MKKTLLVIAIASAMAGCNGSSGSGDSGNPSPTPSTPTKNFEIYHFDLYRLEHLEEIYELGIEEAFSGNHVCLIEWPEKIESILTDELDKISIELVSKDDRKILLIKKNNKIANLDFS